MVGFVYVIEVGWFYNPDGSQADQHNIIEFNQSLMAESHHQGNFTALKSLDGKWCEITYFVCLFVCAVKSSDGLSV